MVRIAGNIKRRVPYIGLYSGTKGPMTDYSNHNSLPSAPVAAPAEQPEWFTSSTTAWLLERKRGPGGAPFISELCERLSAEGVPLARVSCSVPASHPQVWALNYTWRRGKGVEEIARQHGVTQQPDFLNSPIALLAQGAEAMRQRLDVPDTQLGFPILHDLKAAGMTDYVAMPMHFTNERFGYMSWATDRPDGFSTNQLALLWDLLSLIELRLDLDAAYRMSESLLTTYLGHNAARKVLAGVVQRGEGANIHAAIWYSDMRGSTALADRLSPYQLISTLDDYFECMTRAVHEHGGEVLKFIGDGMLAIFETAEEDRGRAPRQAMDAALAALEALVVLNRRRAEFGFIPLRVGIALHVGDVMYGNIGGSNRLDFTVIGRAVNEVARVEAMCPRLERPLLATARFQEYANDIGLESLGFHALRGVREPQELFSLPLQALPHEILSD
jgi:adenylate cyclase